MVASGVEVGLPHDVADLDACHADAAGDRRADRAIAELHLQAFERRLVGIGERARDVDLGLRVVERDDRWSRSSRPGRCSAATSRVACSNWASAPAMTASTRLISRLDRAAVEDEQDVALLDPGAVLEFDRDDLAVDPRLDRDAGDGRHGAERLEPDRDRFLDRLGDGDPAPRAGRHGAPAPQPSATTSRSR